MNKIQKTVRFHPNLIEQLHQKSLDTHLKLTTIIELALKEYLAKPDCTI